MKNGSPFLDAEGKNPFSDRPISDGPISDGPISDGPISDGPISDEVLSEEPSGNSPVDVVSVDGVVADEASANAYRVSSNEQAPEPTEYLIRLAHRGSTLLLVAIFTLVMAFVALVVGLPALMVVLFIGTWVFFSGLTDLNSMRIGRMNPAGRRATITAVIFSGFSLFCMAAQAIYSAAQFW